MSLEETLAILGTLGNLGIQGSEAGTALRRLLTLSSSESEKFQKVFGVATKDAQGNARNLVDVLGEVTAATANMGTADRAAAFSEVFGLLGITSASAIGKSVTDTRQLLGEIQKARGIAAKTATEMDSGIGGAFRILKSSIEGVAIAIGESLDTSVTKMVSAVSRAASSLTAWIGKNQEVVKKVALIVAGVNFYPELSRLNWSSYKEGSYPGMPLLRVLHDTQKLEDFASKWLEPRRPEVEFYDLSIDPQGLIDVAENADYASVVGMKHNDLDNWIEATHDQGIHGDPSTEPPLAQIQGSKRADYNRTWKKRLNKPEPADQERVAWWEQIYGL